MGHLLLGSDRPPDKGGAVVKIGFGLWAKPACSRDRNRLFCGRARTCQQPVDLGHLTIERVEDARQRSRGGQGRGLRSRPPSLGLIAYNRVAIDFLRKGDDGVAPQRYRRYVETIVGKGFHFSSERIRLLALRHSRGAEPARRFARFVALRRSELAKAGKGFFRRQQPGVEGIDAEAVGDRPRLVEVRRWEPDLPLLLRSYLEIAQRAEARGEPLGRRAARDDRYGFDGMMGRTSPQKWANDRRQGGLGG